MSSKIFIVFLFTVILGFAQNKTDDLQLYDNFEAISSDNIFKTEGYYNWGNSIIKEKEWQISSVLFSLEKRVWISWVANAFRNSPCCF